MQLELIAKFNKRFLCDAYRIESVDSFTDMIEVYKRLTLENPGHAFLYTLDDINQALYTSGHARENYELDNTDGHDLSALNSSCFENGEHIGYFTSKEELFIRRANFLKACESVTIDNVYEKNLCLDDETAAELESANSDVSKLVDATSYLLKVPVQNCYETIIAFPNGYFIGDLNPFENYALAKHLYTEFGYMLIGIGASYLLFYRPEKPDEVRLEKLYSELVSLYSDDNNAAICAMFDKQIHHRDYLVLKYTE
jgi:hypothetical protein